MTKKFTLIAAVLSLSLSGSALATPEQCANLLQQSDGYDPYVCGAASLPGVIWPDGMNPAKDGIVQYGPWKVGPQEDDDLINRLPNPRSEEGPFTAILFSNDRTPYGVTTLQSYSACKNLAKAVFHEKTEAAKARLTNGDWSEVYSQGETAAVMCVPPSGEESVFTVDSFVGDRSK